MERIVVLDDWTDFFARLDGLERLRQHGELTVHTAPAFDQNEVIDRLSEATVAIANRERTRLSADVLRASKQLRLIGQTGRVSPNIDADVATELGIALVAGAGSTGGHAAVAELGLALLLALVRRIPENNRRIRQGDWAVPPTEKLYGKTLGILGLGGIGSWMARLGNALGMRVIAWGPTLTAERAAANGVELVAFDALFPQVDALFVSLRLTDLSRGLVGEKELAAMKPSSYLVNIARGPIVDEAALVRALREGQIAGAGLDVYDEEPLPRHHPLLQLDNVVLTPHVGWGVEENFRALAENTIDAVVRYLDGDHSGVTNPRALERRAAR
jgi:D-3-phosphoglycerate dehydrogenase / 2-oxoglutarate reductase